MNRDNDAKYLAIINKAVAVCANYRPQFGQGRSGGLALADFQKLYGSDPFYSWFGLDSPLMYAAHKAAGGMTSVYRQIGIGCQWVFAQILCDHLGISPTAATWSYTLPSTDGKKYRRLSLDGRIPLNDLPAGSSRKRVLQWLQSAARKVELPRQTSKTLKGAVFEVRQGYKSKDSKRQNADVSNASNAYAHLYLPVVVLLSTQIDSDVAERYRRARWLLLTGTTGGTAFDSTYVFVRDVVGYDLAAFFKRNSSTLRKNIEAVLISLLTPKK
jgi:hypothetical protein